MSDKPEAPGVEPVETAVSKVVDTKSGEIDGTAITYQLERVKQRSGNYGKAAYWYAYWYLNGRMHSKYIGKEWRPLSEEEFRREDS